MKLSTKIILSLLLAAITTYIISSYIKKNMQNPPLNQSTLSALDGTILDTNYLKNKVHIISYFQTWCGDCVKEQPELLKLKKRFGDSITILMVSDEPIEKIKEFVAKFGSPLEFYHSSKELKSMDIKRFPTTFLIDKTGKTVEVRVEGINWYSDETIATIEKLIR